MPKIIAHKFLPVRVTPYGKTFIVDSADVYHPEKAFTSKEEELEYSKAEKMEAPVHFGTTDYYLFGEWWFTLNQYDLALNTEKLRLLLLEAIDKEREKFERLQRKFSKEEAIEYTRESIPEEVRIQVWRRDGGQCVKCGSKEKLEYDHIIPVSKGGGNTARNIELLCGKCNREKKDNIQ